jgi:hypothetical protein
MSTRKTLAVRALILGLTTASYVLFAAAKVRQGPVEDAAKDAAWRTKAEMEEVRP